jgi:hypothetical protein
MLVADLTSRMAGTAANAGGAISFVLIRVANITRLSTALGIQTKSFIRGIIQNKLGKVLPRKLGV